VNRLTRHALNCPACGRHLWASTAISDPEAVPQSGDASVCDGCGAILIFTRAGLRVAKPDDLQSDPEKARQLELLSAAVLAGRGSDVS
jgi:hypothetical protein